MHSEKLVRILGAGLTAATLAFGAAAPALAEATAPAIVSQGTFDITLVTSTLSVDHPTFDVDTEPDPQMAFVAVSTEVDTHDLKADFIYDGPDFQTHTSSVWYDSKSNEWYGGHITKDGGISIVLNESDFYVDGEYVLNSVMLYDAEGNSVTFTEGLERGNYTVVNGAKTNVYRLYNPNSGEHFYTLSTGEVKAIVASGWSYEGIAFASTKKDAEVAAPVYRVYNPNSGDHHYTMSAGERDLLVAAGWNNEGIAFYSCGTEQLEENTPVFRAYNPNAKTGSHHYTISPGEIGLLVKEGWNDEGIGWYAFAGGYY